MTEPNLQGCRILVVEDEYLLADDLSRALTAAGADVLGPIATVQDAAALIVAELRIDAAILDVHLRGEFVFSIADSLAERGVPFAFATGYDQWAMPERFMDRPRVEKPCHTRKIAAALGLLLDTASPEA